MSWTKSMLCSLAFLALTNSNPAWADRYHFHHGPRWGAEFYAYPYGYPFPIAGSRYYDGRPYYPTTYRYYPTIFVAPTVTTVTRTIYVEPGYPEPMNAYTVSPDVPRQDNGDWYYCHNPDGFYPAVKSCPAGWQRVPAQAPAER
ncbi:hypothetical protein LPB67_07290 [Undibacterium sp. Jales W-56]|uniref:hypothetical protein n=1 Tax=Undibacterium sp. Jales W-56 TaxID=2897325 RepID=UPI0021CF8A4D|nr:hypothetical protein [Undibacterium sp. Jales W-56]MCU6433580.1 hypothetical protein [Undibacterium sp. Jales W-56]